MGDADLNKDRLELALEAAGLDLWENDLITGEVTLKASKTFVELGFSEEEIASDLHRLASNSAHTAKEVDGLAQQAGEIHRHARHHP